MAFVNFMRKPFFAKFFTLLLGSMLALNVSVNTATVKEAYKDINPGEYKNVILFIGDGMGYNHLYWTEKDLGVNLDMLDLAQYKGFSKTASSSSPVTDSAAGGTALACGTRTSNGCIGVFPQDMFAVVYTPENLCEVAYGYGKLTGVVTSDKNCGATPGAFSAHVFDRGQEEEITRQQIEESQIDLIWGANSGFVDDEYANKNGWTLLDSLSDFNALEEGTRSFGQFKGELWNSTTGADSPNLSTMTEKAIDMLDDDADGFFLMVEGAHIDKHSHSNNDESMKKAVVEFDKSVTYAMNYAKTNGDTLVVVTADHETGRIVTDKDGNYKFTLSDHSGTNVPLLVYGSDGFIKNDEAIKNKDVSRRLAMAMGTKAEQFPIAVKR